MNQRKYALGLVSELGLTGCRPASTPLEFNHKLTSTEFDECTGKVGNTEDTLLGDFVNYQRLIGRLFYLTMTRLDIAFMVQVLSQFMHSPKTSHMEASIRVVKYIKGTVGLGLFMPSSKSSELTSYCDSDWAACVESRRSVTGYVVKFGSVVISWKAKKQNTVSRSSAEADLTSMATTVVEIVWLKAQVRGVSNIDLTTEEGGDHVFVWQIWEEENNRWMEENHTLYLDHFIHNEFMSKIAEQPSNLIIPLLRYQKEWLAWALNQEESTARDDILADDMGMGKTIQAMALVLVKREMGQAFSDSNLLSPSPYMLPPVKGTLVICPVVALIQWVSEIDRFTTVGSNKVLVYHGAKREKDMDKFAEYDFVITTYSTIETENRKNIMILHSMKWNHIILDEHVTDFCILVTLRTDSLDANEEDYYISLREE
uniref:Helicase ATP-binding domain-containing protein n=1 Tax=Solanum lycopersicum TaxID=4081 RepID=A0A3Q7HBJ2_SOLLC